MDKIPDSTLLNALVAMRKGTVQKNRIAFGNRVKAIEAGRDTASPETLAVLKRYEQSFLDLEEGIEGDIAEMTSDIEMVIRMRQIKGVGPTLAAQLVAMIDITRADSPSALWRYAGYGVIDGKAEKPKKGEKIHFNKHLKTACYNLGESFLRAGSPYRRVYDDARAYYDEKYPQKTKNHRHLMAFRKMVKIFLVHLWQEWRKAEGLPIRPAYVFEKLSGHTHEYKAAEFGWIEELPEKKRRGRPKKTALTTETPEN